MSQFVGILGLGVISIAMTAIPASAQFLVARTTTDIVTIDIETGDTIERYDVDLFGTGARGLEWTGEQYLVSDASNGDVWQSNETFDDGSVRFAIPVGNKAAGIARIGSTLFVNGQSSVPPDTLFAMDVTSGTVISRFPMPIGVTTLGDLASVDGDLFGLNAGTKELWHINTLTGAFMASYPMPAQTFAIAGNSSTNTILYVSNADHTVYSFSPTTTDSTPWLTLTSDEFILTAVFRSVATPTLTRSWSEVKEAFGAR